MCKLPGTRKNKMQSFKVFALVCVSLGVCVCVSALILQNPTLSGGDRASPERGHGALLGGEWKGGRERESQRKKERKRKKAVEMPLHKEI